MLCMYVFRSLLNEWSDKMKRKSNDKEKTHNSCGQRLYLTYLSDACDRWPFRRMENRKNGTEHVCGEGKNISKNKNVSSQLDNVALSESLNRQTQFRSLYLCLWFIADVGRSTRSSKNKSFTIHCSSLKFISHFLHRLIVSMNFHEWKTAARTHTRTHKMSVVERKHAK